MGIIKDIEEIKLIRESALLVSKTLGLVAKEIKEGVENSNFKCIEIDKLDNHQIYGYGFPDYCKVKYIKIKPSSEKIGLLSLKKFNSLKNKSIDNINPIYLTLET